jgi:hypothetical protein
MGFVTPARIVSDCPYVGTCHTTMLWGSRMRFLASRFGPAVGGIVCGTDCIRDVGTSLGVTKGFTLYTCNFNGTNTSESTGRAARASY